MREIVGAVRDLLIPATCVVCGRRLLKNERHICLPCLADMPFTYFRFGRQNPMADAFNALIQKGLPEGMYEPYGGACALFYYEGGYSHITQALKYKGNIPLGRYFASLAVEKSFAGGRDFDAIVPVPLHFYRRFVRGFNQAEVIACEIGRGLGIPVWKNFLARRRSTKTQTVLSAEGRIENVSGAFAVKSSSPESLHILLVDDVFTTGATLYACRQAIKASFPSCSISVFTLAYARHA